MSSRFLSGTLSLFLAICAGGQERESLRVSSGTTLLEIARRYEQISGTRLELPDTLVTRLRDEQIFLSRDLLAEPGQERRVLTALLCEHRFAMSGAPGKSPTRAHDLALETIRLSEEPSPSAESLLGDEDALPHHLSLTSFEEPIVTVDSLEAATLPCHVVRVVVRFDQLDSRAVARILHDHFQVDDFSADARGIGPRTVLFQGLADRVEEWIAIFRAADR